MFIAALLLTACVSKKNYDALDSSLKGEIAGLQTELASSRSMTTSCQTDLASANETIATLEADKKGLDARIAELEKLQAELLKDKSKLKASVDDMQKALSELNERKKAAELRIAQFKELVSKFQALIDAGKLQVKIVDGRMVVQLATDVLFDSGSAKLSDAGKAAIVEVTDVLETMGDRKYQVEGHTDNVPIATAQYPSNWELASARALTVVRTMIEAGLPATQVSAASFGETKPVGPNTTPEGKAQNRRIEIVIMPDLSGLPGFDELKAVAGE